MIELLRLPAAALAGVIGGAFLLVGLWFLNGLRAVTFTSVESPGRVQPGGIAEVVARVQHAGEPLVAPLSGERCVGYVLREERRGTGLRSLFGRRWQETATGSEFAPFYLADGSGRILVRPTPDAGDRAGTWPGDSPTDLLTDLELSLDDRETFEAGDRLPDGLGGTRADAARRYTEWRIAPGDVLYVLGRASAAADEGEPLVVSNDGGPFIVSESPQWRTALDRLLHGVVFLVVAGVLLLYAAETLGLF